MSNMSSGSKATFLHILTMLTMLALFTMLLTMLAMLALYVTGHVPPPADHVGLVRHHLHHHCRHLLQLATVVHVLEGSWYEQAMMTLWSDNFDLSMLDTDIINTILILSLRKGLGAPAALPLDDAFHPDVSHWIHLVAFFLSTFTFYFCLFLMFSLAFSGYCLCLKKINRSEIGISISDCCRQKIVLVCETSVLQKCAKYI